MTINRRLKAILCISLTVSSIALAQETLLNQVDPYGSRLELIKKLPKLCQALNAEAFFTDKMVQSQLETYLGKKIKLLKNEKLKGELDIDAILEGNLPGFIRVFQTQEGFTFSFRKDQNAIEAIAVIYLKKDCRSVHGARIHFFNNSLRPIQRLSLNSLLEVDKKTITEQAIENPQVQSAAGALRIGLIDSGVDYNHPVLKEMTRPFIGLDLTDPARPPYDYTTSYQEEMMAARYYHGSAVADVATRGLSVHLIPARVENKSHLAGDAVEFLAQQGVRLINISQGTRREAEWQNLKAAIARHPEILFINSAGNDGLNLSEEKYFPATFQFPNFLVVASIDKDGNLSRFSNYGAEFVHFAALGENIIAAQAGGGTNTHNGTSFSAPLVTRVAARILQKNPDLTVAELKQKLIKLAKMTPTLNGKIQYGVIKDIDEDRAAPQQDHLLTPYYNDKLFQFLK